MEYASWQAFCKGLSQAGGCRRGFKKSIEEAVQKEEEDGVKSDRLIVGFLDEASSQTRTNPRLWSFRKPVLVGNTTNFKVNMLGFYTTNGNSVVDFKENSRTGNFCSFLEMIKEKNPDKRILIVLDNHKPHHTKKALEKAASLDIILVYLPPYSPDLNPIEQIWRALKRQLSLLFKLTTEELKKTIREIYQILSAKTSYADNWNETYI